MSQMSSATVSDSACESIALSFEDRLRRFDGKIANCREQLDEYIRLRSALIENEQWRLNQQVGQGADQLSAGDAQARAHDRSPRDFAEQHIALQCVQTVLSQLHGPPVTWADVIRDAATIYDFVSADARPNK